MDLARMGCFTIHKRAKRPAVAAAAPTLDKKSTQSFKGGTPVPLPPPSPPQVSTSPPLPLPKPFRSTSFSGSIAHPLPPPQSSPPHGRRLRCFDFDEQPNEGVVCQYIRSRQPIQVWLASADVLGQLEHPNLSRLLGYAIGRDGIRLLLFERLHTWHCLDKGLLNSLTWIARLRIGLGLARALAYLQESQCQLNKLCAAQLVVLSDKDGAVVKLACYAGDEEVVVQGGRHSGTLPDARWYGVILLELLTGRRGVERLLPGGDLVQWGRPIVGDAAKLSSVLHPSLRHLPIIPAVREVANLALSCLHSDPRLRPTMRRAAALLAPLIDHSSQVQHQHKMARSNTFSSNNVRSAGASPAKLRTARLSRDELISSLRQQQREWLPV